MDLVILDNVGLSKVVEILWSWIKHCLKPANICLFLRECRRKVCVQQRAATGRCGRSWAWPFRPQKPTVRRISIVLWPTWGLWAFGPCSSPWTPHRRIRLQQLRLESQTELRPESLEEGTGVPRNSPVATTLIWTDTLRCCLTVYRPGIKFHPVCFTVNVWGYGSGLYIFLYKDSRCEIVIIFLGEHIWLLCMKC